MQSLSGGWTRHGVRVVCWAAAVFSAVQLLATASAHQRSATADRLHQQVAAIAAGENSAERGMAITERLDRLEIPYRRQPFERQNRRGDNIIVDLGDDQKEVLMVGAHYDRVAVGRGAVDNAASCAMLLELLPRFRKSPLQNMAIRVAFFDQEEGGLHGSRAYVEAAQGGQGDKLPAAYVNFDIFAYGDSLYVMSPRSDAPLAEAVRRASEASRFPTRISTTYPPSDHLSFLRAGVPVLSVSLIDGKEIDGVIQRVTPGAVKGDKPPIFEIIHSENDTMEKVDAAAIERALPVTEQILRHIDAGHRSQ